MKKLGVITIGQAPRTDVTPILAKQLPEEILVQRGALDGMTKEEIDQTLFLEEGQTVLTTRLTTGESVIIAEEKILTLMQEKVTELEEEGCEIILLLCTGTFPEFDRKKALLLQPDKVLSHLLSAILPKGKLGVICPLSEQVEMIQNKYRSRKGEVLIEVTSPYTGKEEQFRESAKALAQRGAQLIVMDCMGYQEWQQNLVRQVSGVPVLLSVALLARVTAELIGE